MISLSSILLADDDEDDRMLFKEALKELGITIQLTEIRDGVELMAYLASLTCAHPDVLFLDLNMPRKNGFDCLEEIKKNASFSSIPVIIISTSFDLEVVNRLKEQGALYYIRKPNKFEDLKAILLKSLQLIAKSKSNLSTRKKFILKPARR